MAVHDPDYLDDKDYYGNKRLELYERERIRSFACIVACAVLTVGRAGELLALLFEDLFKKFNMNLKKSAKKSLVQGKRSTALFDIRTVRGSFCDLRQCVSPVMMVVMWFARLTPLQCMSDSAIASGLNRSISTGNWNVQRYGMVRLCAQSTLQRAQ